MSNISGSEWAIEEKADDALAAYLASVIGDEAKVGPMNTAEKLEEPCVVVGFESSENSNDMGRVTGRMNLTGNITIRTPATSELTDGSVSKTPRQRHADLVSQVFGALVIFESGVDDASVLAVTVNAYAAGVKFSKIRPMGRLRQIAPEGNAFVSMVRVEAKAQPIAVE